MNDVVSPGMDFPTEKAPACAGPRRDLRSPGVRLPPGACDSHLHILGPAALHRYAADRVYTPPDCLLREYLELHGALGLSRCVFVQPSVYGSDNTVLLEALAEAGDMARGVVVLEKGSTRAELDRMHALGVRGVRVNLVDVRTPGAALPVDALRRLQDAVGPLGWHIELLVHVDRHPTLHEQLRVLQVPLVFGHMGYLSRHAAVDATGVQGMIDMMREGRAWAKLTAPYRLEPDGAPHHKSAALARRLLQACPQRLVWGTDWPHVMVEQEMPHDADLLDLAAGWIPPDLHAAVFVDNPARLYGWPA